jgi:membrane fusion protein, multidrug efflux system
MLLTEEKPSENFDVASKVDDKFNVSISAPRGKAVTAFRSRRRWLYLITAIVASLVLGVVALNWPLIVARLSQSEPLPATDSTLAAKPKLTPVRAFIVGSRTSPDAIATFTGVVRPRYEVPLAFRVGGKILKRHVEVGQGVSKNELLIELEPEDFELQVRAASAALNIAIASVQRYVAEEKRLAELLQLKAVSPSEYEKALADRDIAVGQRDNASQQLELANNQLRYCQLRATEQGIVTELDCEAGQVVRAGDPLGNLAETQDLEAVIDFPENQALPADACVAEIEFWSLPGVKVMGKLREVSPMADATTRTYRARFTLQQPPSEVKLGMTTTVSMASRAGQGGETFAIPASALHRQNEQPAVWLIDESAQAVRLQPIEIDSYGESSIIVSRGLNAGQKIVSMKTSRFGSGTSSHDGKFQIQRLALGGDPSSLHPLSSDRFAFGWRASLSQYGPGRRPNLHHQDSHRLGFLAWCDRRRDGASSHRAH